MSTDETLIKLTTESIEKLGVAISEILNLSKEDRNEKYRIEALGRSIGLIREFQNAIFERHPELIPPSMEDEIPDPALTKEQITFVSTLNENDIRKIDDFLLENSSQHWRKVARIVGKTMMELPGRIPGTPDIYYSQRVRHLVEKGALESQGNLAYMRYSEVRLPQEENE